MSDLGKFGVGQPQPLSDKQLKKAADYVAQHMARLKIEGAGLALDAKGHERFTDFDQWWDVAKGLMDMFATDRTPPTHAAAIWDCFMAYAPESVNPKEYQFKFIPEHPTKQ